MTRASEVRPVRRLVDGGTLGPLVLELRARTVTLRPYRCRRPILEATHAEVARAVLLAREPRPKKGKGKRAGKGA